MEGMKGRGRAIATFLGTGTRLELRAYPDGSMGIIRNATSVGVWERAEQDDCVRTFISMGTTRESPSAVLLVDQVDQVASKLHAHSYLLMTASASVN